MGGIEKYVREGSRVGLLPNGKFSNRGTYTDPDISLAVLKLCSDAGAKDIMILGTYNDEYWKRSGHYNTHYEILQKTSRSKGHKKIAVEKGIIVKEAEMIEELFDLDVLINLPVSKHHNAAFLTCYL